MVVEISNLTKKSKKSKVGLEGPPGQTFSVFFVYPTTDVEMSISLLVFLLRECQVEPNDQYSVE